MKQIPLKLSVSESAGCLKNSIEAKGFTVFADIDHQANGHPVLEKVETFFATLASELA
jgi:uncharacterized protein (DUF302 family)